MVDGGWLVAFFRLMGVTAVRGSSNRRGVAALIAGNLGQVIGVSRVVVTPGESLATRRA